MQKNEFTDRLKETSPVPERISPESIEKKLEAQKRSRISVKRRAVSAAAAVALVVGGSAGYLYKSGYFDKEYVPKTKSIQYEDTASQQGTLINSSESGSGTNKTYKLSGLKTLSYDELGDYIKKNYQHSTYYTSGTDDVFTAMDGISTRNSAITQEAEAVSDGAAADNSDEEKSADYSKTYTQEEGIDEADIVKTDGKSIFYLTAGHIFAIECDSGKMEDHLIDFKELFGDEYKASGAQEMYLDGGTLTVILSSRNSYNYTCWDEDRSSLTNLSLNQPTTNVITFDVSDLDSIKPTGKYTVQGSYVSSRMADSRVYLVTDSNLTYCDTYEKGGIPEFAPIYTVNGSKHYVSSGDIFIPEKTNAPRGYTNLSLIDTKNKCLPIAVKSFLGSGSEIYQTAERLILISAYYDYEADRTRTTLTAIDTADGGLEPIASTSVDGYVKDKYSLSYKNNVLSVVTNESDYDAISYEMHYDNYLYCFDDRLTLLGQTESFGKDETVKSVTYKDNYAYVVTFMQTDPLFAIDLSDPRKPTIVSELKMPGFSTHMRPFTEGRIVGFGNTANEETGRTTGLKLSVYDNSDPNNVKELAKAELTADTADSIDPLYIQVYYSSAATYDEKALLIDPEKNIIAFPYCIHDYRKYESFSDYSTTTGYRFYSYTDEEGLTLKGTYSIKNEHDLDDNMQDKDFIRAAYIGDTYYLFYYCGVISVNAESFEKIDELELKTPYDDETIWYDDEYMTYD
ncbi:MAG: beta-propeller domain-containing protein [Ruminococcus sp.]|nr:beta-propeller domain-containing protein [Ruminococcus sp.]